MRELVDGDRRGCGLVLSDGRMGRWLMVEEWIGVNGRGLDPSRNPVNKG